VLLDENREKLKGGEFDFLLFDRSWNLALCETAGFGEVPDVVLELGESNFDEYADCITGLLASLRETGNFQEEEPGVGTDVETPKFATRGLFVFDWRHWSGPYRRVLVPERPVQFNSGLAAIFNFARVVPRIDLAFADTNQFQLSDVVACR